MKAVVNTYLNVRTGQPALNADNNPTYYNPGDEVEIVETVVGESYKGNNVWHRLANNSFIWSGGVGANKLQTDVAFWNTFFRLDTIAAGLSSEVKNLQLALLDTGIDSTNTDLDDVVADTRNFIFPDRPVMDFDGHGTYCGGIIAGNGKQRISGILKGARVHCGKIITTSAPGFGGLDADILKTALGWAAERADIISLSAGITDADPSLHELVQTLTARGKIIVAAIGNLVASNDKPNYPARFPECISVGSLANDFSFSSFNIPDNDIDICFPGENIMSTFLSKKGGYTTMSGTSVATPFVAGIAALIKLKNPQCKTEDIKRVLLHNAERKTAGNISYSAIKNKPLEL